MCDYEMPSALSIKMRVARKSHKCCECRRQIPPREVYEYASGIWGGSPESYKTCNICVALREYTRERVGDFCWGYGSLREDALSSLEYKSAAGSWFGAARMVVKANILKARNLG